MSEMQTENNHSPDTRKTLIGWVHMIRNGTRRIHRPKSWRHAKDKLFTILLALVLLTVVAPFFMLLYHVGLVGLSDLLGSGTGQGLELFTTFPGGDLKGGVLNAIVGSMLLAVIAGSVGIPLSVFGAVYITEYSRPGLVRSGVEFAADVLAGIPSIVFGAFGFTFLVVYAGLGVGLISGGLTLAFMMIPTILRTTQEALRQVPMSLREASLALGATRWSTTWRVSIKAAFPGVITGVLLALGRTIGETAPLIFTAGNNLGIPNQIVGPGSWVASLPYTIWAYITDPRPYLQVRAHSTALTLLLIVLTVDMVANIVSRKVTRRLV
ncbi:MAG: phosphate ABC transporter permease PstA [Candidatus Thorarchaeota archaeon]|nr:phosphate ABC transporter permease PstA [Candidatus Thorarchaeota archaeon]